MMSTWNVEMSTENLVVIVLIAQLLAQGRSVGNRDMLATDKPMPVSPFVVITSATPLSRAAKGNQLGKQIGIDP